MTLRSKTKAQLLDRIGELENVVRLTGHVRKAAESRQARAEAECWAYKLRLESVIAEQKALGLVVYRATAAPERPVCVFGSKPHSAGGLALSVFEREGVVVGVRVTDEHGTAVAGAGLVSYDRDAEEGSVTITPAYARTILDSLGSDAMADAYNGADD